MKIEEIEMTPVSRASDGLWKSQKVNQFYIQFNKKSFTFSYSGGKYRKV